MLMGVSTLACTRWGMRQVRYTRVGFCMYFRIDWFPTTTEYGFTNRSPRFLCAYM